MTNNNNDGNEKPTINLKDIVINGPVTIGGNSDNRNSTYYNHTSVQSKSQAIQAIKELKQEVLKSPSVPDETKEAVRKEVDEFLNEPIPSLGTRLKNRIKSLNEYEGLSSFIQTGLTAIDFFLNHKL
jgi:hypothetical protein